MAGTKSSRRGINIEIRPSKRTKLLSDEESSDSDNGGTNGVALPNRTKNGSSKTDAELQVNAEYARRFEHNKKREEKDRLEEKYKNSKNIEDDSESDSSDESEDDEGEFATKELDNEIFATLKALQSKDPRIYDSEAKFFTPFDPDSVATEATDKSKPMRLQDYHRKNLLQGAVNGEDNDEEVPQTYDQEQESLRRDMVKQMHETVDGDEEEGDDAEAGDFLVRKPRSVAKETSKSRARPRLDVEGADRDPETYLSNFMKARAWVPDEDSRFAHLNSDDSEEERDADAFEQAYNLRFEDPKGANEKLQTFVRGKALRSVRREDLNPRQKQREREREAKEQAKQQRREEKARLRKLKVDEVEQKVQQIKQAAGLGPADVVDLDEWRNVLNEDWDDNMWEAEMKKRFGDDYYAEKDAGFANDDSDAEDDSQNKKTKRAKKPKWDDDIDIKDILPEYEDDDPSDKIAGLLSDHESDDEFVPEETKESNDVASEAMDVDRAERPKSRKEIQAEKKRAARQQRMKVEELVDNEMSLEVPQSKATEDQPTGGFRYRETEPISFGLTARDILFADDTQLNQFAGIKKHHAFRDEEKRAKDLRKLGKKQRLRQWRKDTFGDVTGYKGDFASYVRAKTGLEEPVTQPPPSTKRKSGDDEGEKKRKRRKKKTTA